MKVLSLLQPWATLVVIGAKKIECRTWKTDYRGIIIIHASGKKPKKSEQVFFEEDPFYRKYIESAEYLPYGALIGKVELLNIYRTEWLLQNRDAMPFYKWEQELAFDDFSPKRYAWQLDNAEKFDYPLPIKGSLGLWEYNGL
ncbi:MAG TPA: ASCH domain-containing protein [Flavisolibacter sp.]|nr:ASCH domain-containing protein [Flavisolibacter sp.]